MGKHNDIKYSISRLNLFEQEKNIVVSPLSVLTGLGLLYEGMGDSSRAKVAIGFPNNHETFLKMFKVSQKNHSQIENFR